MIDPIGKDERQELIDALADAFRSEGIPVEVSEDGIKITILVDEENDETPHA